MNLFTNSESGIVRVARVVGCEWQRNIGCGGCGCAELARVAAGYENFCTVASMRWVVWVRG